jgi:hypothetical protein
MPISTPESLAPGETYTRFENEVMRVVVVNGTIPPRVGLHVVKIEQNGQSRTTYEVSSGILADAIAIADGLAG